VNRHSRNASVAALCIFSAVGVGALWARPATADQETLTTDDVTWGKRSSEGDLRARNREVTPDDILLNSIHAAGVTYYKEVRKTRGPKTAGRLLARYLRQTDGVVGARYNAAGHVVDVEITSGLTDRLHLFKLEARDPF
jgi:hypothetical protein